MATYRDDWRLTACFQGIGAIILAGGCAIISGNPALAQSKIVPDATLGAESSVVVPNFNGLPVEAIAGGAQRGQNLFHSFKEFNVSEGRGAYFFSPNTAIQNILARVTGSNRSEILGVLGTFGNSQPNLFLINPNGIIFGQNAQLDVGGSFVGSTANSLVFGNGFEFSATNPQAPPLLTVNVPLGLQYGANSGRIVNQSIANNGDGLEVQPGRTLALVGGEIAIEGGVLFAPDGRIELGSVAGNSRVSLTPTNTGYTLGYDSVENFQDIRLTQEAYVTTDGDSGGSIQVQGRNVTLTDGSQISASLLGAGKGGGLVVNASDSVQVIGTSPDGRFSSGLFAGAEQTATGKAGDLRITTGQFLIRDGAQVSATTFGAGEGGNLFVNASDSVQVVGESSDGQFTSKLSAQANPNSTGNAGDLRITTKQLLIRDGAQVSASTFGSGKGGSLIVNASDSVQVIGRSANSKNGSNLSTQANENSISDAGDLTITTDRLLILGGAFISTDTYGAGKGGNLTVNASDSVQVIGESVDGRFGSKLSAQANENATGKAGDLTISTGQLLIMGGAFISTSTFGFGKGGNLTVDASDVVQVIGTSADGEFPSQLSVQAEGTGNAGSLTITTPALLIRDGAQVSASTFGSGKGGNLIVNASDWVQVIGTSADGQVLSNLSAQAQGKGDAGSLTITTPRLLIRDGALVSASTYGAGKGGNLTVNASDSVQVIGESIDGKNSSILSVQTQGSSDAGNLTITTARLLIRDSGQVSASTFGSGQGGNLIVNASDSVQVIGTSADGRFSSGLFASATAGGTAGDLTVTTRQMSVWDGGKVTVSSPQGRAGNLTLTANSLTLNQGTLSAVTGKSGADGGANITLQSLDLLRMDNESFIAASALEDANGGNVKIDSTFIVATSPTGSYGSDIQANAIRGNGGRVDITTQGLFGTQFRPKQTPDNDITASSEFGINGEVTINQPNIDPRRGLTELPTTVVDATRQIDRRCNPTRADQRSSFVITGRGGLPPSPNDPLQGEAVITNWVTLDSKAENTNSEVPKANSTSTAPQQLVEAQSWVYDSDGRVILVAQAPTATPQSPWQPSPSCRDLQPSANSSNATSER